MNSGFCTQFYKASGSLRGTIDWFSALVSKYSSTALRGENQSMRDKAGLKNNSKQIPNLKKKLKFLVYCRFHSISRLAKFNGG